VTARIVYWIDGRQVVRPLDKDVLTLGRDQRNDIVIERPSVSRRHARLERSGQVWHLVDVGSAYGTRINDGRVVSTTPLADGDRILLHDFPLTFADGTTPEVSLSAVESPGFGSQTVFQDAVDFSSLAAGSADASHLQRLLQVVTRASQAILASSSLDATFQSVLELVFEHLPVERGFIMLWDGERQDLATRCVRYRDGTPASAIRFSRTIAEKVCRERVAVLTTDAQADDRFAAGESVVQLGIRSAMAAPLWNGSDVDGLLYVDTPLRTQAFDRFDLDLLSALGNQVAMAIGQSRLQQSIVEQRLARRRLERYHSPAVVERITAGTGADDALAAEEREVTVIFADVVEFTRRCEQLGPRQVAELLNRYFAEMAQAIFDHEGTLDKFIGDGLMAVFGAPLPAPDHARRAVEAVLDMREALERLNEPLSEVERVRFRVGIHSGSVVAGDIGSPQRTDYTVLGATVNLAARLESAVAQPGQIVLSETTMAALGEGYETRPIGERQLKGISRGVACHELLGRRRPRAEG
jgi:adenylate cyclase